MMYSAILNQIELCGERAIHFWEVQWEMLWVDVIITAGTRGICGSFSEMASDVHEYNNA